MRLSKMLAGIIGLSCFVMISHAAGIQDSLDHYDTDDYGNVVYFGKGTENSYSFIFVDGSATAGMFSSASILRIKELNEAGYAVVPANTFEEMSRNAQFAKIYTIDCDRQRIRDEDGVVMRLSNASAFHQTSAAMACSVLN